MKKEFIFPDLNRILDSYNKYGFVIIRNVLGRGLLEEINNHIDWLIKKNPEIETEKLAGKNSNISNKPIYLKILSKDIPNLTLIDLPGLTMVACTDRGQPKDIKTQIRNMIGSHILS